MVLNIYFFLMGICSVFVWMCVHACMDPHVCTGIHPYSRTHTWGGLRLIVGVFLHYSLPLLFIDWKTCSSLVSFAVIKHSSEATWRMEMFFFVCCLVLIYSVTVYHWGKLRQEFEVGTWRQEMKQKVWRNPAYWLSLYGSVDFTSCILQYHWTRDGIAHSGLGSLPSVFTKEMLWRHIQRQSDGGHFLVCLRYRKSKEREQGLIIEFRANCTLGSPCLHISRSGSIGYHIHLAVMWFWRSPSNPHLLLDKYFNLGIGREPSTYLTGKDI